jgi:hypothetical protein
MYLERHSGLLVGGADDTMGFATCGLSFKQEVYFLELPLCCSEIAKKLSISFMVKFEIF